MQPFNIYVINMCLHINSNAAFLILPKTRSRGPLYFYFSNKIPDLVKKPTPKPWNHTHQMCDITQYHDIGYRGGKTNNGNAAIHIKLTAKELDHCQSTPIFTTDNSTYDGIINTTM